MIHYNETELLICIASRQMEDGSSAFIGTGLPMLAAALAKRIHAPNLVSVFEFGGIDPSLEELPKAVGDVHTFHRALVGTGICDIMETAARGHIEYGFLGGAQIDPYGNINSTIIGSYNKPKVRLPGSGGGNDVGSLCWKTIIIMQHDRKRFVPKVDYITTPGYLDGPGGREKAGLPPATGPFRVVTSLALLDFEETTKKMRLIATNPGVTVNQVKESTGFELIIPASVPVNTPPEERELSALREEIDPGKIYI